MNTLPVSAITSPLAVPSETSALPVTPLFHTETMLSSGPPPVWGSESVQNVLLVTVAQRTASDGDEGVKVSETAKPPGCQYYLRLARKFLVPRRYPRWPHSPK